MTVRELREKLFSIEDQDLPVCVRGHIEDEHWEIDDINIYHGAYNNEKCQEKHGMYILI